MARNKKNESKRPIASCERRHKQRVNNPPMGLVPLDTGPDAGANQRWARLTRNLKAEIDQQRGETCRGTVSLPFETGQDKRIAVKMVKGRGIENLKLIEVEG